MSIEYTAQLDLNKYPETLEIEQPDDFGFTLFKEQRQVLYIMNSLEQQQSIKISTTSSLPYHRSTTTFSYTKLRLAACLSFGKTLVTLALIKLNNTPISRTWYTIFDNNTTTTSGANSITARVRRKYFLDTNLVIVSQSVYQQWIQHIKITGLKFLGIETNTDFRSLCILFINDKSILEQYDLVIMIYRHLPHDSLPHGASNHMSTYDKRTTINVLSLLSLNTEWKRVIIDDFDSINIAHDMIIPTRITWLISTTLNYPSFRFKVTPRLTDLLSVNHKIMDSIRDLTINSLSIRADLDITNKILPQIKVTTYVFLNAYLVNRIINDMNYSDEVIERINSGDVSGAAAALGITVHCDTAGEFLSCVLEKNKTTYFESIKTCSRFDRLSISLRENNMYLDDNTPNKTDLSEAYSYIAGCTDEEFENWMMTLIVTKSDEEWLNMMHGRAKSNVTRSTHVLDRLKRNIEGGECQKCLLEPEGNKYILNCCNIILCQECMTLPNSIFIYRCPNCIKVIDKGSIVEVPEKISLEQFLEYDINHAIDDIDKFHKEQHTDEELVQREEPDPDVNLKPKEKALIKLIKGEEPDYKELTNHLGLNVSNIPESRVYMDQQPDKNNKFLVFVKWATCANELQEILRARGIQSVILRGTAKTISRTIDLFKTNPNINVIFMYSTAYCAGLNLEFATHMIFYHSIMDKDITTQLIGRAQRLGRKESLNLIYLRHKGERHV